MEKSKLAELREKHRELGCVPTHWLGWNQHNPPSIGQQFGTKRCRPIDGFQCYLRNLAKVSERKIDTL